MPFDVEGAKKAGYSDSEIADYLASQSKFDTAGARKAGYSDSEIISHLSSRQTQAADTPVSDIPTAPGQFDPSMQYGKTQKLDNESLLDKATGAADAGLSMLSGATTGLVGQGVGTVKGVADSVMNGTYGTQAGADAAQATAEQYQRNFTRQPSTEIGQRYLQNAGEFLSPLSQIDPNLGAVASVARAPSQGIGNAIRQAIPEVPVNGVVQPIKQAASDIADVVTNPKSLIQSPLEREQAKTDFLKSRLESGDTSNELAGKTVVSGRVVNDPIQKAVIDQGIPEGTVRSIAATNDSTRQKLLKMTNISEIGSKNDRFKSENRPSDVVGDSLAARVKVAQNLNSVAGKKIDQVAEGLKDKYVVDNTPVVNGSKKLLEDLGVSEDGKGGLIFKGSDIEGLSGLESAVKRIYTRSSGTENASAYDLHRLKRYLDQNVDYGKGSNQAVTAQVERAIKDYRRTIDKTLDGNFPEYDKVNTQYSDSIGELNKIQDASGRKLDLSGENVDKALGTKLRGLLSNNQNRVQMMDSIKSLDAMLKKYGVEFDDDIITQVNYANALDDHFGAAAATSLRGDIESGAAKAGENILRGAGGQQTAIGLGVEASKAAYNKIRGRNKENSYKALKALLSKKEEKK